MPHVFILFPCADDFSFSVRQALLQDRYDVMRLKEMAQDVCNEFFVFHLIRTNVYLKNLNNNLMYLYKNKVINTCV